MFFWATAAAPGACVHAATNGPSHKWTKNSATVTADALDALGRADEAAALRVRFGLAGKTPPSV